MELERTEDHDVELLLKPCDAAVTEATTAKRALRVKLKVWDTVYRTA